jgi:hypothetical protein
MRLLIHYPASFQEYSSKPRGPSVVSLAHRPRVAYFMHELGELGDFACTKEKMRYLALVPGFIGRLL